MRRFMLPIFVLTALALGACGEEKGTAAPGNSESAAPQGKGDDKTACATAKSARDAVVNDLLLASMTIADKDSSAADITEAAQTLKAGSDKSKLDNVMEVAAMDTAEKTVLQLCP